MEEPSSCLEVVNENNFSSCENFVSNGVAPAASFDPSPINYESDAVGRLYRPRGALARTIYFKYLADERLQNYDKTKWYHCETEGMEDCVRCRFLPLGVDLETELFLDQSCHKSDWIFTQLWHSIVKSVLGWFMTQTSINGLLGRGSMFVFSQNQFLQLLSLTPDWRGDSLLDLGAGDGRTTEVMAPLFSNVYVTEISGPMRWILSKRGFQLLEIDDWANGNIQFDVISCLNLLDRCNQPLSLLQDLKAALRPGGWVVVALVLPFSPYVEMGEFFFNGGLDHRPTEWLPIKGTTFEDQVASAITDVLEPAGFDVVKWTRVPYLCEGDLQQSFYWLDDAVFVLRVKDS